MPQVLHGVQAIAQIEGLMAEGIFSPCAGMEKKFPF
jgi:hypothetical protein